MSQPFALLSGRAMSDRLKLVVQGLLRPSEIVNAATEAYIISTQDGTSGLDNIPRARSDLPHGRKRVVAVVTHFEPQDGDRGQGCVIVIKMAQGPPSSKHEYSFERAIPITDGFSMSMAQMPSNTVQATGLPRYTQSNSANTAFTLTIAADKAPEAERLTLLTYDSEGLRTTLTECRRCKEISALQAEPQDLSWLAAYIERPSRPAILSSVPPDLRMLQKPVHTLLSPASAGQPGDEAFDMAIIREDWIRRRVRDQLLASTAPRSSLRIRVGTFNVNGKMPTQDLSSWLRDDRIYEQFIPPLKEISPLSLSDLAQSPLSTDTSNDARDSIAAGADDKTRVAEDQGDPDLFVLAFQELDLSAEALLYSTKTVREDAWCAAVFAGLGEKAVLYEKLVSKQLVGMLLLVIVRKRLRESFSDIRSASVGAGIMGMMGNKGATAVRMAYAPTSSEEAASTRPSTLTFVNSHLAAFDEMVDRRNADFHDICKRLLFDTGMTGQEPLAPDDVSSESNPITLNIFETDVLFWMGDLNYRLNLPETDVRYLLSSSGKIRKSNMELLLRFDQLYLAQYMQKAFENFKEHPIRHAPSYRFATDAMADTLGYDTKRKPAWTDRILHTHSAMVDVEQSSYGSHPDISMSDHKPISANFDVRVASLDATAFDKFVQGLWREVGSIEESDEVPRLRVDATFIDFGTFSYRKPSQRSLHVENIGKTPCTYRFIATTLGTNIFPEWLEVDQVSGLLLPGESTDINISTRVDKALATKLNISQTEVTRTLILHTAMGKDHFITAVAKYERTSFANNLSMLARLPGPIRGLKSLNDLLPADHAVTAPREVMRLINWLMTNATNAEGLFLQAGDSKAVDTICECLDTGVEFPFHHPEKEPVVALAFGEVFMRFLEMLPDPVIPVSMFSRCAEVSSKNQAFELLEELPAVNLNVWISTTAILHYFAQQDPVSSRIEQFVAVFTSVLLPDDPTALASPSTSLRGKRAFLRYFIS